MKAEEEDKKNKRLAADLLLAVSNEVDDRAIEIALIDQAKEGNVDAATLLYQLRDRKAQLDIRKELFGV
jgi:hypothetical protein